MTRSFKWLVVVAALVSVMLLMGSSREGHEVERGLLSRTVEGGGRALKYVLYVPREYDGSRAWPLIVFLHGKGECGDDGLKQVTQGLGAAVLSDAKKWPYIILMPQKPDFEKQWEDYDDLVMEMLSRTERELVIDSHRRYLTGLSQGGHGTWVLGARYADVWAAIAPICGYGEPDQIGAPLAKMPIWAFHGDADTVVPPERSKILAQSVTDAGGAVTLTLYPGVGHNSWDKAYREEGLQDWFLLHSK
jgi:predicted peptidase